MSDIFDYLTWRGDLTFGNAPLCPVDGLILSILPYIRLEPYLPSSQREEPVRLADAAAAYLRDHTDKADYNNYRRLLERLVNAPALPPCAYWVRKRSLTTQAVCNLPR